MKIKNKKKRLILRHCDSVHYISSIYKLGHNATKAVFPVSDKAKLKPVSSATEM